MPTFSIMVDSRNLENRVQNLSRILGPSHGGSTSASEVDKTFAFGRAKYDPRQQANRTELEITHSIAGDFAKFKTVVAKLRSLFPEMVFKSGLLDQIMAKSTYFRYVICRGFVGTSAKGVTPQQLEFVLVNTRVENAMVIAQDSLDSAVAKQIASAANLNENTIRRYCKLIAKALPHDSHGLRSR